MFMVMINDWIFHRKSIGQGDRLLHKFPPPDGVAEIYVVAHAPVQCFFDGKSNRLSPPLVSLSRKKVRRNVSSVVSASLRAFIPEFSVSVSLRALLNSQSHGLAQLCNTYTYMMVMGFKLNAGCTQ